MLAPGSEAEFGEPQMARLLREASEYYQAFTPTLSHDPATALGYETRGTLLVGLADGDAQELERIAGYLRELDIKSELWSRSALRERTPMLSRRLAAGLLTPDDHQVDPRRLVQGLLGAAQESGIELLCESVIDLAVDGSTPRLRTDAGTVISSQRVVLAVGAPTGHHLLPEDHGFQWLGQSLHPVRGEIIRLNRDPFTEPIPHTLRALTNGRWSYLVTRANGELVLGATAEFSSQPTLPKLGTHTELATDMLSVVPDLREATIVESSVGFRPGSIDNLPIVGAIDDQQQLWVLNGLYRHGVLLAPLLGRVLAEQLMNAGSPSWMTTLIDPARLRTTT
jgi:glycine oxidase